VASRNTARPKIKDAACVLSIAGLDPGGGAGLLADARAISRAGAFPCGVAAVLTVQSTAGLKEVKPVAPALVLKQARAVFASERVRAVKVGALGVSGNVKVVAELAAIHKDVPFVVDPVLRPTRGSVRLTDSSAWSVLKRALLPRAALVTANVPEAEALLKVRIQSVHDARDAAHALSKMTRTAALVKGGHLGIGPASDFLVISGELVELKAPRLSMPALHGGGCALSSLIAGRLAVDERSYTDDGEQMVLDAVRWAKRIHHRALGTLLNIGGDLRVMTP
jgi:hydroxymethylpyrimidine/phosphomethylpyrimidine kinase